MAEELSPREAAARLGATTRSVQRWIADGRLPARRVGGRWRVASDAIDALGGAARGAAATSSAVLPIRTVFVANRGEIARRIARACERVGIRVVVPATDGPDALDLLDAAAVIAAALASGADALHPGFGFLAENPDFADAVATAGIRWVGPPADAIRAMGDKAAARRLARRLGVPVIPGYDGANQSDAALRRAAREIGLPVVLKPSGGGGGKGMRVARSMDQLPDALAVARREALAAFGDDRLVIERYLEGPRHVEVQVLFDRHGTGVHLGERDCSIQRRHQKILEETPSPAVGDELRSRMGDAALALARAVGYESAGTCEFLVDDVGAFHFLEMNTRLQVEHPVTEAVTGRDLVADQLRIAAGEPLGFGQDDVHPSGHAIEVRLYAEDADAGFLPATGRVAALRWPAGDGIRVDAGIDIGTEIGGRFDPMLAKIVAHGADRDEALDRLKAALDETVVLGLVTNLRFLRWLVRHPAVLDGEARIDTLERVWPPDGWSAPPPIPEPTWLAAARALGGGSWRLNGPSVARLEAEGMEHTILLADDGVTGGNEPSIRAVVVGNTAHLDVEGRSVAFCLAPPPDVDRAARSAAAHHHGGGPVEVEAPMPGSVLAVHVAGGTIVEPGDPIATLEAMKMEHVVAAPIGGRIDAIHVAPGDQLSRTQPIATIDP